MQGFKVTAGFLDLPPGKVASFNTGTQGLGKYVDHIVSLRA
jgi:hypothetical protein